jgi:hypothetical protein
MSNLSVLIVAKDYPPVRATHGRLVYDLARSLAEQGHKVTIATIADKSNVESDKGIDIYRFAGLFLKGKMKF